MRSNVFKMVVLAAGIVAVLNGAAGAAPPGKSGTTGLCRAWAVHHRAGTASGGASHEATAFAKLARLAGGAGNVNAFCQGEPAPQEPVHRYQAQVLADGASAYWSLDRGTYSGGVFTGVGPAASGLTPSLGWVEGRELLAPPSVADASSITPGPQGGSTACCSFTGPFSVSAWIELPVGQSPPPLASFVDVGNGTWTGFHLTYNGGDVQFVTSCGIGCESEVRAAFAIAPGTPTMFAASFDGTIGRIYANGTLIGSAPMHAPAAAASPHLIGAYHSLVGPFFPWTGYIDSVTLFPVALGDAQIADHFAIGTTAL